MTLSVLYCLFVLLLTKCMDVERNPGPGPYHSYTAVMQNYSLPRVEIFSDNERPTESRRRYRPKNGRELGAPRSHSRTAYTRHFWSEESSAARLRGHTRTAGKHRQRQASAGQTGAGTGHSGSDFQTVQFKISGRDGEGERKLQDMC